MQIIKPLLAEYLLFSTILGGSVGLVSAQTAGRNQPVDVIIALDNSGSMKQNDPNGLVKQAALDFAGSLPAQSRLGVVIFDQRVDLSLNLTKTSDAAFHTQLAQCLTHVDYSGKWTDIPGGIERAIYALSHDGRAEALKAIVFFTDGMVETGDRAKDVERSRWLREDLAAEARQHGIRLFGVAFTEAADYELIQSVAQTTGGEHYRVLKSSDVAGAFAQIGSRILEPLPPPTARPASSAAAPPAAEPEYKRIVLSLLAIAVLGAGLVWWLRLRRGRVPAADFAHLIDVGKRTGAERIPIRKRLTRIGRDGKLNDITIAEKTVTSRHACIEYRDGTYFLGDLRSSNGTFVNGKQISTPDAIREVLLKSGDRIRFDAYEFVFCLDALSVGAPTGEESAAAAQRTVLRAEAGTPAPVAPPQSVSPRPEEKAPLAPTIQKPVPARNAPASTVVKSKYCPTHSSWLATDLCSKCGIAKCKQCMVDGADPQICLVCANGGRNLT